jgi:hypothetical protein
MASWFRSHSQGMAEVSGGVCFVFARNLVPASAVIFFFQLESTFRRPVFELRLFLDRGIGIGCWVQL